MDTAPADLNSAVLDLLLDTVCVVDAEGRFVFTSASCLQTFGYTPDELRGRRMIDLVHPEDRERTLQTAERIMAGENRSGFENRYLHKDGHVVHVMWSARWSDDHRMRIAVARDVTARKRDESRQSALYAISEAAHAAEDLATLFRRIHQITGGLLPARNFTVALHDPARGEITYPYHFDESHEGATIPGLHAATLCAAVVKEGRAMLVPPGESTGDQGSWIGVPMGVPPAQFGAVVVHGGDGCSRYGEHELELLQFISAQIGDAVERRRMHARLQHIALYDQLTELPNRELLNDRLRSALGRVGREDSLLAVLYLDLDGFKQVNDSLGHSAGDRMLQEVARRLARNARSTDTVARIGGDEFVVLLEGLHGLPDATRVAEKLRVALAQPMEIEGRVMRSAPSIGVAMHPAHGESGRDLLQAADLAMYVAKRSGGNRVWVAGEAERPPAQLAAST